MRYLSLFSGVEAASVAWAPLGWTPIAFVENDPFCCAVLAHHYPAVPNLGDITAVTEAQIAALGPFDLIVMGSPCQDVSIAGQRKGLENADGTPTRSGLFFTAMQLVTWARQHNGCRWVLCENVPGLLSSRHGRDFAAVVGALAGTDFAVPRGGWGNTGVCLGPAGLIEWRVLDAEWFGVPQRRHRVFALADFGDWAARPPVLVDAHCLSGHPAPCREARQDVAACPPQGVDSQGKGWYAGRRREDDVNLVGYRITGNQGAYPVGSTMPTYTNAKDPSAFVVAQNGSDVQVTGMPGAVTAGQARGTSGDLVAFDPTQITSKTNRSQPQPGDPCHPLASQAHPPAIAYGGTGRLDFESETFVVHSESQAHKPGSAIGTAMAFTERTRKEGHTVETLADTSCALCNPGSGGREQSRQVLAPCLTQNYGKQPDNSDTGAGPMLIPEGMMVRRLTPLETERLQGLHDRWTLVPYRGKLATDSPRYRAVGNSFAVPVIRWIGERLQEVTR